MRSITRDVRVFPCSTFFQRPTPMFATYTATKAAVDSFVWSLNTELGKTPIMVQTIHPGATQTGFFEKCGVPAGAFDTSKFARKPMYCFQPRICSRTLMGYFIILFSRGGNLLRTLPFLLTCALLLTSSLSQGRLLRGRSIGVAGRPVVVGSVYHLRHLQRARDAFRWVGVAVGVELRQDVHSHCWIFGNVYRSEPV